MKICVDCNKAPRMENRRVCMTCRHKRIRAGRKKLTAISEEYKIHPRFGFVMMKINGDWIKSTLTPWEVTQVTGEELAA